MNYFDTTQNAADYRMTVNNLSVGINMPDALKSNGDGENEESHGLPPYRPRRAFLVDEYPACPANWMRSSGRTKSYFVPLMEDTGLWLDFNGCSAHTHHVAVVVSIQGINAVTGLPCKDPQLEQYRDECPKHKEPFGPDRLCKKCNFKWPKQNYLTTTATPSGQFWLDGFRAENGKVRQYVFTAAQIRSVAKAIVGEDRAFALGIGFFLSKEVRPRPAETMLRSFHTLDSGPCGEKGLMGPVGSMHMYNASFKDTLYDAGPASCSDMESPSLNFFEVDKCESNDTPIATAGLTSYTCSMGSLSKSASGKKSRSLSATAMNMKASVGKLISTSAPVTVKQMEIAAGARIDQQVHDDPNDLEFWQKEPDGLIVVNYCTQPEAMQIINAGKIDLSGSKEGFLQNIPTGNP